MPDRGQIKFDQAPQNLSRFRRMDFFADRRGVSVKFAGMIPRAVETCQRTIDKNSGVSWLSRRPRYRTRRRPQTPGAHQ